VLQVGVGHWVSVWQPRPVPIDKMRNTNLPLPGMLAQLSVTAAGLGLLAPLWAVFLKLAPGGLVPAQLLVLAACIAAYRAALPHAARYLERRSEWLAERLG
jgi:hypothetical protein